MTQTRDADASQPGAHPGHWVSESHPESGADTDTRSRGFSVVMHHIDDEILTGTWVNGSRLPPERELAATLGVSRGAVREAIRALEAQGILTSGTGRGNGTRVDAHPSDAMGRILRLQLALDVVSFADLTETRVALEKAAVASAARIRQEDALQRSEAVLSRMYKVTAPDAFNELDTEFHVALAAAGGNHLMSDLTMAIREAVHSPIRNAEQALDDWSGFRDLLVADHAAMLDAVRAGDEEAAAARTEVHIRSAYATLLGQGKDLEIKRGETAFSRAGDGLRSNRET